MRTTSTRGSILEYRKLPVIAISSGDPAGIGPEVVVKALTDDEIRSAGRWLVVGEQAILATASKSTSWSPDGLLQENQPLPDRPCVLIKNVEDRRTEKPETRQHHGGSGCGGTALRGNCDRPLPCRNRAMRWSTAPLSKEAVTLTGRSFTGHTEYIAELCGCEDSRMLLVNDRLCGSCM